MGIAKSTDFESIQAPLKNAFEMFIRPLLGEAMSQTLIEAFEETMRSDEQERLIELAQRANVFLAYWYDFNEMQVYISDSVSRLEGEKERSLYKYQEQKLQAAWKEKGFNALDDMLNYLYDNIETFEDFTESPNYSYTKTAIVQKPADVDQYYYIGKSRIIFLRLLPHFKNVIDTRIRPRLGNIYDDMIAALDSDTPNAKYTTLREKLLPVVVFMAISRLIAETGSLTDKGLFFESLSGTSEDFAQVQPVGDSRNSLQKGMADADGLSYWKLAEQYLISEFDFEGSTAAKTPKRDNNDKKSFWG